MSTVNGVIGLGWGDEGKGEHVDEMAAHHDVIVRYNGGPNAGHSLQYNGRHLALHQIPSGVLHPGKLLYIASGCVVDMPGLVTEIKEVEAAGIDDLHSRLRLSSQATVIQPHHVLLDKAMMYNIGTTGKGIATAYAGQKMRLEGDRFLGFSLGMLLTDPDHFFEMMERNYAVEHERVFSGMYGTPKHVLDKMVRKADVTGEKFDPKWQVDRYRAAFEKMSGLIDRDPQFLIKLIRKGMDVLMEGAQAGGLDIKHGTMPYVTASSVSFAAAFESGNLPLDPSIIGIATGVYKATPSRVGWGPFVSEFGGIRSEQYAMEDDGEKHRKEVEQAAFGHRINEMLASNDPLEVGQAIRLLTGEYGVTSKRPRRLGAIDAVHLSNAINIIGVKRLVLRKVDVLQLFSRTKDKTIPVVTGYMQDKQLLDAVPNEDAVLRKVEPTYKQFDAFPEDISDAREPSDLPPGARRFLHELEDILHVDIGVAGVGPERGQSVRKNGDWATAA